MAQVTDRTVGANPTGFDMRTELNNIIGALESDNSGSSEPLNPVAYMKWLDTSDATYYYYKERNHDNTAWVTLFRYTVATKIMEVVNNGTDLTTTLALKANSASPTFTGTVVLPSTTSIGTITSTELSYLDGVTSAIQTQINAKTELSYLDVVTSAIQTQINAKQETLVSGTNIKTINSNSLLGSGDLVITSGISLATANSYDLGVGQTLQYVTTSRSAGVTYTNTTGKPIYVSVTLNTVGANVNYIFVDEVIAGYLFSNASYQPNQQLNAIVPNGSTYRVSNSGVAGINHWSELR